MSKYGIEKVDGDFIESLDALQGSAGSKYVRLGYSNSKPLLHFKRDGKTWSGFRCEIEAAKHYDHILRKFYNGEYNTYNFPLDGEQSCHR